jgi:histidine triad (HIT) family protein
LKTVRLIANAAKTGLGADGVQVEQFNEAASGQTVYHLHFHIIPRFDGVALKGHASGMEQPDVLAAGAEKIRGALQAA